MLLTLAVEESPSGGYRRFILLVGLWQSPFQRLSQALICLRNREESLPPL